MKIKCKVQSAHANSFEFTVQAKCKVNRGFTIIELLVVITIFVLIGVIGINFFASILSGSGKTAIINEVNQNGSYSINLIERFLRNADKVTDDTDTICQNNDNEKVTNITILNPDGGKTTFMFTTDASNNLRIASISGGLLNPTSTLYLTNNDVVVNNTAGTYYFACSRSPGRSDKIEIVFTLEQKPLTAGLVLPANKKAVINFRTSVLLRNN